MILSKTQRTEIKVGIFTLCGITLLAIAILLLGGEKHFFERYLSYWTTFPQVNGLIKGSKVVLNGVRVGYVRSFAFGPREGKIKVTLSILERYQNWIRKDTSATVQTQGVLGDKYVYLNAGMPQSPALAPKSEILSGTSHSLEKLFFTSESLMKSLYSVSTGLETVLSSFSKHHRHEKIFKNIAMITQNLAETTTSLKKELKGIGLKKTIHRLYQILNHLYQGKGTLGALLSDNSVFEDLKDLTEGLNRSQILKGLIRTTIKENRKKRKPAQTLSK